MESLIECYLLFQKAVIFCYTNSNVGMAANLFLKKPILFDRGVLMIENLHCMELEKLSIQ
jgi:hypothetical protein